MAERMKDDTDLFLQAALASRPIADDGFSVQVVTRVRRRNWLRRLALPVGIAVGLAISARPLIEAVTVFPGILNALFGGSVDLSRLPFGDLPQLSTLLVGAALGGALLLVSRILEE